MSDPPAKPCFSVGVYYKDPRAALDWLEKAFGFERTMVITDKDGKIGHSQMRFGDGLLYVGPEWFDYTVSPASVGGKNTGTVHIQLPEGLDAHCERARAAGAAILQEPQDQFYGDRTYRARDPEGHVWTFSQAVRKVGREEAEKASGLTIDAPTWP